MRASRGVRAVGGVAVVLTPEDNPSNLPVPKKTGSVLRRINKKKKKGRPLTAFERDEASAYQLAAKPFVQTVRLIAPCAIARAVKRDYGVDLEWPDNSCVLMWLVW